MGDSHVTLAFLGLGNLDVFEYRSEVCVTDDRRRPLPPARGTLCGGPSTAPTRSRIFTNRLREKIGVRFATPSSTASRSSSTTSASGSSLIDGSGSYFNFGGLLGGRIVEIFGPESSGKTTLVYHVIA
jgi:RecA/RadA recombinase